MTLADDNLSSSSSPTRAQEPQGFTVNGRLIPFSLRPIKTRAYGNRSISPPSRRRKHNWNVATDERTAFADEKDDTLAFDPIGLDHVIVCIVRCYACDFKIKVSLGCCRSEEFDANNMICPVCNEKLGEDAIRTVQNSTFGVKNWRAWSALDLGKNKHAARMFGSALSSSQDNLDGQSFNDFSSMMDNLDGQSFNDFSSMMDNLDGQSFNDFSSMMDNLDGQSFNDFSSDEDDMTDAPDVTAAKGVSIAKSLGGADAPNTGSNEQDVEERSKRAAFAQKMFLSALFSE